MRNNTMTADELLKLVVCNRVAFLPNTFDDAPIQDAIAVLGEDRLSDIEAKARRRGWSQARKEVEIRCVADEVYWQKQGAIAS